MKRLLAALIGIGVLAASAWAELPTPANVPNGTNVTVTTTPYIWTNDVAQVYLTICVEAGSTVYGAESYLKTNVTQTVSGGVAILNTNVVSVGQNLNVTNATFFVTAGGPCYMSNSGLGLWRGTVTLRTTNSTANVRIMGGKAQ